MPSGKRLICSRFIFQHENDPKHNANTVKAYLDRKGMSWMKSGELLMKTTEKQVCLKKLCWKMTEITLNTDCQNHQNCPNSVLPYILYCPACLPIKVVATIAHSEI